MISDDVNERIRRQANRIRHELSSRSRPVMPGCVIRIPFASFSDEITSNRGIEHIYGVVGREINYNAITTSRSYDVQFNLKYIQLPEDVLPLLHLPMHDNEMEIVRFPDQNASLDDPHLDVLFHKVEGEWKSRD